MAAPARIPTAELENMGKKELVEAVQKIAPLAFLTDNKLNGPCPGIHGMGAVAAFHVH